MSVVGRVRYILSVKTRPLAPTPSSTCDIYCDTKLRASVSWCNLAAGKWAVLSALCCTSASKVRWRSEYAMRQGEAPLSSAPELTCSTQGTNHGAQTTPICLFGEPSGAVGRRFSDLLARAGRPRCPSLSRGCRSPMAFTTCVSLLSLCV